MPTFPLSDPAPDFAALERVVRGEQLPRRVHFVELGVDAEMQRYIVEQMMGEKWIAPQGDFPEHLRQLLRFYLIMGYDYIPIWPPIQGLPQFKERRTSDTAVLSRGERSWAEESSGIIEDWDDFHSIPWDDLWLDSTPLDVVEENLPEGMKMTIYRAVFDLVVPRFLGYEGLCFLSQDQPDLVAAVFEKWGETVYRVYAELIGRPGIGAIFHADDLGHKTGTMMSPDFLCEYFFPWLKRYAELAHAHGKTFWCHCCGNVLEVVEYLIEDVKIDAFHSFQDVIIPITEFHERYSDRIAALGGVDMDLLARLPEGELQRYVRNILDECMPRGRFALGSGNTVANYIPPANYLAMMQAGLDWPD